MASNYVKEAWELHVSAGERVCLTLAPHEKLSSILGSLRSYKARSIKAYMDYGMCDLAEELAAKTIRHSMTPNGLVVWLEEKSTQPSGSFTIMESLSE